MGCFSALLSSVCVPQMCLALIFPVCAWPATFQVLESAFSFL